jgi:sigma-B regulation protein RsbU (phosphoserine phosphatase)
MGELLRVLIIDDSEADALLLQRALHKGGFEVESTRVETAEAMREAIADQRWDVAISDCHMPEFTPEGALAIWQEVGQDQPLIVASGAIGEEEAVALLKAGAKDFVRKDNLSRLVTAIERELRETEERRARKQASGRGPAR